MDEQVKRSLSSLLFQLGTDRSRLFGLLSKAVGGGNVEVTGRLSKVGWFALQRVRGQKCLRCLINLTIYNITIFTLGMRR